ncbi:MAG: GNAT family N-acetyltransferase [Candidatus Hodarchaeales archaeon]
MIREYQNTDFLDLLDISQHIWEGEDYLPRRIDNYVKNPNSYPMVALEKDKVISIGNFEFLNEEIIWIEALRTHPNFRNKGWAQKLINEMLIKAQSLGAKEAWMLSNTDNLATLYMFSKLGFREKTQLFMWPDWDIMNASLKDRNIVNVHLEKQNMKNSVTKRIAPKSRENPYVELINSLNLSNQSKELSNNWKKCSSPEQVRNSLDKIVAGGGLNMLIGEFKAYPMNAYKIKSLVKNGKIYFLDNPSAIVLMEDSGEVESGMSIGINTTSHEALESLLQYLSNNLPTTIYWLFYPPKIQHSRIKPGFHHQCIMQKELICYR